MPIRYESEERSDYLLVRSIGTPESADEMFAYIQQVYAEVVTRGLDKFLVDESNTSIHFDFHRTAVSTAPVMITTEQRQQMRVAVVCASHSLPLYKHLQELTNSNGLFNSKVFDNIDAAHNWLASV